MVFLAITRHGIDEAIELSGASTAIWCGSDAISAQEFKELVIQNVSRFEYPLANADKNTMVGALATIAEHHPGERIWIECAS